MGYLDRLFVDTTEEVRETKKSQCPGGMYPGRASYDGTGSVLSCGAHLAYRSPDEN